ncbi:hypothetical protein RJ640_015451 [Escallonia rubra]|uniref:Kinesin motor domain-containing protein n=1 Tax=Escallonia rubra TaxID=112253 RepID=A0AA88RVG3_9ASTE|nr:hypothetical protein RJ640_015451 [Escallonia rubra]
MPFISEAASAIKSRFGFHDHSSSEPMPSVRSSPDLLKSSSKESLVHSSAIRSVGGKDEPLNQSFEFREDPSFWNDHNVQVIIRIRPLNSSEISLQGYGSCVRQDSSQTITWSGHPESRFTFDLVADENVTQERLFKVAGVPMVENCMGGYNSCMFAYGQTGSGKTHTMLGDIDEGTRRHSVNCGMTPRVFEYLFSRIQKEKEARRDEKLRYTCKCSFLEIYNEQILDLLDPSSLNLQIREDSKKGVYVDSLREVEVSSARDVIQQLVQGAANRKVAATNMNRASSRSHSVFTCIIESKWESQGVTHHRFARLNLVDLAGSERQKSSGAEGERLKEATNINKSLSTLGLVIMNLVSVCNGKSLHVPYRDSKLTFLLQDSLGGNSKTIIIANITPSSCCSLETLSTLKFAQRAKFIKNHATVNEDASGDVLAMRMQIQQLKKEVSRLQLVVNGGAENHESDACNVSFPGSPGSFKWEGLHGSFSPFSSDKRISQKKEFEVALVGAFRREREKDTALQSLMAENQAAMKLAKQREDEIQGLKMRLRFREAGIKRLEAVASGKISAETHLLKEKEELLKEIEVLRTHVDRNQEVTRFAMENLRLKEEIRRHLLETLDWKLMHESDPSPFQKGSSVLAMDQTDGDLLVSSQESASPWRTIINEENEFLRMQAIQNQSELDALRKKLMFCIEEKDQLLRNVDDLEKELEAERSVKAAMKEETQKLQIQLPSLTTNHLAPIALTDQIELKTMVDAISAASQREAEAHETAILLSKENDELRIKLKVLIEDNNKLIELYEGAVAENHNKNSDGAQNLQEKNAECHNNHVTEFSEGKGQEMKRAIENLEHQLAEMHEENEKLMGLYEKAMQEKDEFKRRLSSSGQKSVEPKQEYNCPEKLFEDDYSQCSESPRTCDYVDLDEPPSFAEIKSDDESNFGEPNVSNRARVSDFERHPVSGEVCFSGLIGGDGSSLCPKDPQADYRNQISGSDVTMEEQSPDATVVKVSTDLNLREAQARARANASSTYLKQKKEELGRLQARKKEIEDAQRKSQESEINLKNYIAELKPKIEEENRRQESEKVLLAIDNVEKTEVLNVQRNWHFSGKATELLKSEEEKTKLQVEMKQAREKHGIITREVEGLKRNSEKVDSEMQVVQMEIQKGLRVVEEMDQKLQRIIQERGVVLEMKENGRSEFENLFVEYHQSMFEAELREAEMKVLQEELKTEMRRMEELQAAKSAANERKTRLLEFNNQLGLVVVEDEVLGANIRVVSKEGDGDDDDDDDDGTSIAPAA